MSMHIGHTIEQRPHIRAGLIESGMQCLFSVVRQQPGIDIGRPVAAGLTQDIGDALVCGGKTLGFLEIEKRLHRLEPKLEIDE